MSEAKAGSEELAETLTRLAASPRDEASWEQLFRLIWPFVFGALARLLRGRRELAEEGAQEVFFRLAQYCRFPQLTDPKAFRAYVWIVSRNVARNIIAGSHIREEYSADLDRFPLGGILGPGPQSRLEFEEILKAITAPLGRQDSEIVLLLAQGHGLGEIATRTGLKYSNVAVRLHRIRKRLSEENPSTVAK